MSILSLIFNKPTRTQISCMQLDASVQENHVLSANVSQSPIEDGSNIADHITINPKSITISGLISDVPLSAANAAIGAAITAAAGLATDTLGGIGAAAAAIGAGSVASLVTGNPRDPSDSFKYFEELFENRIPFTVITRLKQYENMVIKNFDVPRSASNGRGLRFTLQLEQVIIVESSTVTVPSFRLASDAKRGQSNSKLGKQAAKTASAPAARKSSLLLQGFQKVGIL